ncbi:MAG: DEAD/DEAH box helicase [Alcanivorax sp.]
MSLKAIITGTADIHALLKDIIFRIHTSGPVYAPDFETLAYIKIRHPETFKLYERRLVFVLGLFFKTGNPQNIFEAVYNAYSEAIQSGAGIKLTPVQADIYDEILNRQFFSFSAPTSTGKSFIFREIIKDFTQDIVVVVPSRALIAEYMAAVKRNLQNDKSVLVMEFPENINKANTDRRIYIITPERGGDLFRIIHELNVGLFLFDEAQISEEDIRGMTFDAFVRRSNRVTPQAKKVFTHPFIQNPDAQLKKHGFTKNCSFMHYDQHSVGKVFISLHKNNEFHFFSPYNDNIKSIDKVNLTNDIATQLLKKNRTLLIYISKDKIYKNFHIKEFSHYVELCPKVQNKNAKKIISTLQDYIGATEGIEKHSSMIDLMERGIVIHHGSIPLKARLLIEQFVNEGHCKICFATSTLIQGINMPFDAVWIDNFKFYGNEDQKILGLKNLIGRSGRTSHEDNTFDYGYVIINNSNKKLFANRLQKTVQLQEKSLLDQDISKIPEDQKDLAEAIQNDTFNTELNLTETQIKRIKDKNVSNDIRLILDKFINKSSLITEKEYRKLPDAERKKIKDSFQKIYLSHLRKNVLSTREKSILGIAISIMLWRVQGKSFKEIVSLRYSFLSRRDEQRALGIKRKAGEISESEFSNLKAALKIRPTQTAETIPTSNTGKTFLFGLNESILSLNYDKLVYDTYDYLDKVIAQCLVDPITGALDIFYEQTKDARALTLKNYIRYGTNNQREIWLLKYGFEPESIEWITDYILSIDEHQIIFSNKIKELDDGRFSVIERYVY